MRSLEVLVDGLIIGFLVSLYYLYRYVLLVDFYYSFKVALLKLFYIIIVSLLKNLEFL